ncbi:hypothetical protein D9757_005236 [Collybiopsis confluens]|uniref:Uncharacterized protein n=1 Tax=Collybiopsis confluens TaxID=2823264 RepID=A0A8H5HW75_9AGAR|nr:hypothetical protein D9757_005236 [Collybiopsis confluens]
MYPCTHFGENVLHPRVSPDFASPNYRLRSKTGPASIQPEEVASILKNAELDLQDYEAEIDRSKARALFLTSQKEGLREYATRVKMLLSPIRRLPDELLSAVFDLL